MIRSPIVMRPAIKILLPLSAALVALTGTALADQVKYISSHPIAEAEGEAYCYIEAPHVHTYRPRAAVLYRVHDGHYFFAGDPQAHGFEGEAHAYYGHHPIQIEAVVGFYAEAPQREYCYIDGPHYHVYEPPSAEFSLKGELYWYTGEFEPAYKKRRPRYRRINRIYGRIDYRLPVVTVRPPEAYVGPVLEIHAHGPGVEAGAGARLEVPVPRVEVEGGASFEFGFGAGAEVEAGGKKRVRGKKGKRGRRVRGKGRKGAHERWRKRRRRR